MHVWCPGPTVQRNGRSTNILQVKVSQSSCIDDIQWYLMLFHIILHRFLQIRFQSHRFKFYHLLFISKCGFCRRSLANGISQLQAAVGCWHSLDEILHMFPHRYWIPGIPNPKTQKLPCLALCSVWILSCMMFVFHYLLKSLDMWSGFCINTWNLVPFSSPGSTPRIQHRITTSGPSMRVDNRNGTSIQSVSLRLPHVLSWLQQLKGLHFHGVMSFRY